MLYYKSSKQQLLAPNNGNFRLYKLALLGAKPIRVLQEQRILPQHLLMRCCLFCFHEILGGYQLKS